MNNPNEFPLSFVLPIYRAEPFLAQAIESILRQKVEKEIILVIDGSPDNCLQIALDYARRYPFVSVVFGQNRGVSAARNRGLALARGEYVLFLDPDDVLDPHADFALTYELAKRTEANVVKGQFLSYAMDDPAHIYTRDPLFAEVQGNRAERCSTHRLLAQMFAINWLIASSAFLYERAFLLNNGLAFDERVHYSEDGIFIASVLSCAGWALEVPLMFMNYRLHKKSAIHQVNEKRLDSGILNTKIMMEKVANCADPELKNTLSGILALYFHSLHCDVQSLTDADLKAKYQNAVSPEMIAYYQQYGIALSQL